MRHVEPTVQVLVDLYRLFPAGSVTRWARAQRRAREAERARRLLGISAGVPRGRPAFRPTRRELERAEALYRAGVPMEALAEQVGRGGASTWWRILRGCERMPARALPGGARRRYPDPHNIASRVAVQNGGLESYDGLCGELADAVQHLYPDAQVLYVELTRHRWCYHMVPVIAGVVHDAWHPRAMLPPADYVREVFGDQARSWEIDPGWSPVQGSVNAPPATQYGEA